MASELKVAMTLPKRNWMEMTWQEIASAETARWVAVLPLAAVEQHGPHLPLGVDTYIAEAYLTRVHEMLPADLPVTFLPVQRVGVSAEHLSYPGTLTFSATTAITAWTELGEGLARAGVRKLVLVTSHGGNVAAMELVAGDTLTTQVLSGNSVMERLALSVLPSALRRLTEEDDFHCSELRSAVVIDRPLCHELLKALAAEVTVPGQRGRLYAETLVLGAQIRHELRLRQRVRRARTQSRDCLVEPVTHR